MIELRTEDDCFTNEIFAISHDNETLCFSVISVDSSTHILQYIPLNRFNESMYSDFTIQTLKDALQRVDENFFMILVERVIDAFRGEIGIEFATIYVFQLSAVLCEFPNLSVEFEEIGFSLGEADENSFSLQLNDNEYFQRFFVFTRNFYNDFFSTDIKKPYSKKILKSIPKLPLFYKFKDYFTREEFGKVDFPEIERELNKVCRPDKIKKILGD